MSWPLRYIRSRAERPSRLQHQKTTLVVATNAPTRRVLMAAACLLLALSFQVIRSFRAGLVVPPPQKLFDLRRQVPL